MYADTAFMDRGCTNKNSALLHPRELIANGNAALMTNQFHPAISPTDAFLHLNNAGCVNLSSRGSVRSTASSSSPGGGRQLLRPWGLIPFTSSPDTTAPPL